jgi:hypothetical protein
MNTSSLPPQAMPENSDGLSSRPPRVSTSDFLHQLTEEQFAPETIKQYLGEIHPLLRSLMYRGNLSELIYNLAINEKLLPMGHQHQLIDAIQKYSERTNYLGVISFEEANSDQQNRDFEITGIYTNMAKKWLNHVRSMALINLAHSNEETFFATAKAELLLSILVCQVNANQKPNQALVNLLPPRQREELEEVSCVHDLIQKVREKRMIQEQLEPSDQELLMNFLIKSPANFQVIFDMIFNPHLLPSKNLQP